MITAHRIPYTDFDDPAAPIAFVLEIQAEDKAAAYEHARGITDPAHGALPKGCRRLGMRVEEVWPFLRDGHAIRRRAWTGVQVLRQGTQSALVLCDRNLKRPEDRHEWVGVWGEIAVGPDLLAEDWEIVATPEKFPS